MSKRHRARERARKPNYKRESDIAKERARELEKVSEREQKLRTRRAREPEEPESQRE